MENKCENCRHVELDITNEPCLACMIEGPDKLKWEPQGNGGPGKVEDIAKALVNFTDHTDEADIIFALKGNHVHPCKTEDILTAVGLLLNFVTSNIK